MTLFMRSLKLLESTYSDESPSAIVPSRCYAKPTPEHPLRGLRIAIKDMFDIKNLRTSLCSLAWNELFPPRTITASSIQRLIEGGAVLVAKTKLNAMIIREETMECVEYTAPFNPRADGYQTCSGSSSGSCAALAGYEWLDAAIGSDSQNSRTNETIRYPLIKSQRTAAAANLHTGTESSLSDPHMAPSRQMAWLLFVPCSNVPAFFVRDLAILSSSVRYWYGESLPAVQLLVPQEYFPTTCASQSAIINGFIETVEQTLGQSCVVLSLQTEWDKYAPIDIKGTHLSTYLKEAGTFPYYREACEKIDSFVSDYTQKYGMKPFLHKAMRWRW
ncbi:hypothetical protein CAC42_4252 [Sphaceloma murrayae]|uniref:Amidase domain-containing protein n=1 Tax=Sphaceloma murrayae TaxID=2082308 RepID=A0A2K1QLN8_9PEZI|nr:hypothetical protein CAC42_4252 [Sphaceloma murrayae]